MRAAAVVVVALLVGCAAPQKVRAPESVILEAIDASMDDANAAAKAGKLPRMADYISAVYEGVQQRVPNLPAYRHAFFQHMIELAPRVDEGKMTVQQLIERGDLRAREVMREERNTAERALESQRMWTGIVTAIAASAPPRQTTTCTSYRAGSTVQTQCQ